MGYDFNGTSAKISWGDVTFLDGLSALSIHCWVNLDTLSAYKGVVSKMNGLVSGASISADDGSFFAANSIRVTYEDGVGDQITVSSAGGTLTTGAGWQSVGMSVLVNSATGLKAWTDGTGTAGGSTASYANFPNSAAALVIGVNSSGAGFLDGQIAELACWNRVLTGTEWTDLAAGQSALFMPTGLLFYARLSADANDEIGAVTGTVTAATLTTHPTITYPGGAAGADTDPVKLAAEVARLLVQLTVTEL